MKSNWNPLFAYTVITSGSYYDCYNKKLQEWHAYLVYNNQRCHLGSYLHEEEAAQAYNKKVLELTDDKRVVLNDV